MPQPPQCAAEVAVSVSQPSPGAWLQSARGALHDATLHVPAVHA